MIQIESTTDYSKFATITGNRNLNEKKIQRIIDDIDNGLNLLPLCPIIVYKENDRLMIVDGQHRFEVSKRCDHPIHYVEGQNLSLQQIARLNSRQEKWTQKDFLRCYIRVGIQDYKILNKVLEEFRIPLTTTMSFLMGNSSSVRNVNDLFKAGEFKVNHLEETKELFKLNNSLFGRYVFSTDRNLLNALQRIVKKGLCDFDVLRTKISKNPMMMDKQTNYKNYILNIEKIYNHRNNSRVIIY
ncbi:ParB/Srx family N-terminal domain-containing protein [Pseudotenacibaculum haliotis]|uniref:ParB/Srx family N-terminal domain-containing protein n=1 Tax=Pseudotenacibaculum haliotis TaxID=1862138 RepID=A0ABW5LML5_9FLAO